MRVSSPLPSPPSPGSGASPSSAANLAAHRRLAAIDPFADRDRLFDGILAALLTAAHAERGLLMDPVQPERFACAGVEPSPALLEALAARGAGIGRVTDPLPEPATRSPTAPLATSSPSRRTFSTSRCRSSMRERGRSSCATARRTLRSTCAISVSRCSTESRYYGDRPFFPA